jgi:hypothetical protein|nr:DUF3553 domain-containing protein [Kofleriaceae bacterium]
MSSVDPITRSLLDQLAANPDDLDRLTVLADHLSSIGDARGELIAVFLANKTHRDRDLAQRRGELLHDFEPELEPGDRVTWGNGFIRTLELPGYSREQLERHEARWQHLSLALLSELDVELRTWGDADYVPRLLELVPRSLRALRLTSRVREPIGYVFELAALPRLERLAIDNFTGFYRLAHPRLQRLEFSTRQPFAHVTELAPAQLPDLYDLAITGTTEARDFDYLVTVLANTGWLDRLTHLTLAGGDLSAFGTGQLVAGLAGRKLLRLELPRTRIRKSLMSQLERVTDELVTSHVTHELGAGGAEVIEYVEHAAKPEWGRGRVVRRFDGKVEIEFADDGIGRRVFRADAEFLRFL